MTTASSSLHVKRYRAYFTSEEVEKLSAKQRGKLSVSREERARQQACGFLDAVGVRCGFPRKTIATAQTLYMRFHLFLPYKDFNYVEVALSVLYVASKLHDTLKKPRDIILASYAIRFPQLVKKGVVDPTAVDPNMLEGERKRVLGIERLVLETMCFKFGVDVGLDLVVKIGSGLGASKDLCQHAWRIAVDCHRSPAPLCFPPHVIALASLYTACILLSESSRPHEEFSESGQPSEERIQTIRRLGSAGEWESKYFASWSQVDDVTHALLDLYNTILSLPVSDPAFITSPSPVSPKEAGVLSHPASTASNLNTAFRIPSFWTPQTLTEVKIHLRERRPGSGAVSSWMDEGDSIDNISEGMGQNEGTVRFLWESEPIAATQSER